MQLVIISLSVLLVIFLAAVIILFAVMVRLGRHVSRTVDNSQKIQRRYEEVSSAVSVVSSVIAAGSILKKLVRKDVTRGKK